MTRYVPPPGDAISTFTFKAYPKSHSSNLSYLLSFYGEASVYAFLVTTGFVTAERDAKEFHVAEKHRVVPTDEQ